MKREPIGNDLKPVKSLVQIHNEEPKKLKIENVQDPEDDLERDRIRPGDPMIKYLS